MKRYDVLEQAQTKKAAIDAAGGMLTDEQAITVPSLFDSWKPGVEVVVDQRQERNGKLYKVLQAHTTQEGWEPENTPALYVEVAAPGEYREIKDGMLSTEAFAKGEVGWYKTKGNLWESLMDSNIYTPDSYPAGWGKCG